MGFQPWVPQQDSNWEIRVVLLLSLLLQALLIFLGPTRKRHSTPFFCFIVWSCYLLADWVADLALGLLLNNMGVIGSDSSSPVIFAFWTPFLLLHLGGPDTITAYSLEDNELWRRHLIGVLFELSSVIVIFVCSVRGNPMILATVLILVAGVIKYGERTYSLYRGSTKGFDSSSNILPRSNSDVEDPPTTGLSNSDVEDPPTTRLSNSDVEDPPTTGLSNSDVEAQNPNPSTIGFSNSGVEAQNPNPPTTGFSNSDVEFPPTTRLSNSDVEDPPTTGLSNSDVEAQNQNPPTTQVSNSGRLVIPQVEAHRLKLSSYGSIEAKAYYLFCLLRPFFGDMTISWYRLAAVKDFFQGLEPSEAFDMIQLELNFMYDMMYTKAAVAHTWVGWVLRFICSGCIVSALAIFFSHDKGGMKRIDVGITYALLLGALALDMAAMAMLLFSDRAAAFLQESQWFNWWLGWLTLAARRVWRPRRWSETTSQLNLISDCVLPLYHSTGRCSFMIAKLRSVAKKLQDLIFIQHVPLNELHDFIFHGAKDDTDINTTFFQDDFIKMFNSRGERVLEKKVPTEVHLMYSVKCDFVRSLLTWHIATDICLLDDDREEEQLTKQRRLVSKALSEYLLYLLVKQSEMVSAKEGEWLSQYQRTCDHLKEILACKGRKNLDHNAVRRLLQEGDFHFVITISEKSTLPDAITVANFLRGLEVGLRWEVVSGVWMEMLTFTATKCGATAHLRQLNCGGELITLIWLLREQMGLGKLGLPHATASRITDGTDG